MVSFIIFVAFLCPTYFCQGPAPEDFPAKCTKVTEAFIAAINKADSVASRDMFTDLMKTEFTKDSWSSYIEKLLDERGKISRIKSRDFADTSGFFELVAERGSWNFRITLATDGHIDGFELSDPEPGIPVPKQNSVDLSLPFQESWYVKWGGTEPEHNRHLNDGRMTQYGVDFVVVDKKGLPYTDRGTNNSDYYSYNKPILSSGNGVVTTVIDGIPDNTPGSINPLSNSGNTVIIKHDDLTFALYGHIKPNSISVKVGDRVLRGQVIGRCGNSGRSTGPHLHFHLMNTNDAAQATSFIPVFKNVLVEKNGGTRNSEVYSPLRGDIVKNIAKDR
jgi:murein DD-endopeptidase MepM/ murein hydrolase activator NlpD